KRVIDKKIHLAAPLFSAEFFKACMHFQDLCYEPYTGWGRDALLRTTIQRRQQVRGNDWRSEWDRCFSSSSADPMAVQQAYKRLMTVFSNDIGVHRSARVPDPGAVPGNI